VLALAGLKTRHRTRRVNGMPPVRAERGLRRCGGVMSLRETAERRSRRLIMEGFSS